MKYNFVISNTVRASVETLTRIRVFVTANVFGNARVFDDARANASEYAHISRNANVFGNARVFDDARIQKNY